MYNNLELRQISKRIGDSYRMSGGINHENGIELPSRRSVINILECTESLIFPGFQIGERVERSSTEAKIQELHGLMNREIKRNLKYKGIFETERTEEMALALLQDIPVMREELMQDVDAAFRGDPAAGSRYEIILSYPGMEAITIHRIAHRFYLRELHLIARMMSEHVHRKTGIDIHPGAHIGPEFFVDHGTGVVIGETAVIGRNVKIYQGVTIGALSVKKEYADKKRHPTIGDEVTIYAGATILGGKTTVGKGSVIGGNVWITESVAPFSSVYNKPSEYRVERR